MSDILHSSARSLVAPMLFSALSAELRAQLIYSALAKQYSEDQIIQQRGETAHGFYLIASGSVSIGQFLSKGEFRAVAVLGPGDSWGELAMFANRPRVVDAIARGPCEVRFIRSADFEAAIAGRAEEMRMLLSAMSVQFQDMLDMMAGIRRGTAHARVAGLLDALAGASPLPANVRLTQQELGELLGLTRVTINAALKELEAAGAIARRYGQIEVLDKAALDLASLT